MTSNFEIIREELLKEKTASEELTTANKKLKDELDRVVRSSKTSRSKIDEMERLYAQELEKN